MNPVSSPTAPASGERKLRAQERRRGTLFVLMVLLGFLLGLGLSSAGDGRLPALPPAVVWIGVGLIAVAAGTLTVVSIRRADEVEISDQLWSGFVGLQVFAIGAPCWEMLAAEDAAPPVDRFAVYFTTTAVTLVTYLWRRFRRG
ncbi:MAG: hypothetical protein RJB55_2244 [Verrucomicrobiota bacterium]